MDEHSAILLLRIVTAGLYLVATAGHFVLLFRPHRMSLEKWLRGLFGSAIVLHISLFVYLWVARGHIPSATVYEGLYFCGALFSLLSFSLDIRVRERSYGAVLYPLSLVLVIIATVFDGRGSSLPKGLQSPHFLAHVSLLFLSYAFFLFSSALSAMYLIQYRLLKNPHRLPFFRLLPSLHDMERSATSADAFGLGLLVMGTAIGFFWLDSYGIPFRMVSTKFLFTFLSIAAYTAGHLLRISKGWQGARARLFSMAGFGFVLLTLVAGRHGY